MRRFPSTLLIVALSAARSPSIVTAGPASSARDDTVATLLRAAAQRGTMVGLKWPRFSNAQPAVDSLYRRSAWRPVWTVDGRPTSSARTAIGVLLDAEKRGLHPDDYDAPLLDRTARALAATRAPGARNIAWFDVALSVGVLRHVADVSVGRVDPKHLSIGINVAPKKLNLIQLLRQATEHRDVARLLRDAEPRVVQYRQLKDAYTHYRELAARPPLPEVEAKTPLRPGDPFPDASALRRRLVRVGDLLDGAASHAMRSADSTRYDTLTAGAVRRFQERHGLTPDGVIGPGTLAAINVPLARRVRQLELAMERLRWLPEIEHSPFVIVNVPAFRLYAFDSLNAKGTPSLMMNVVVGRDQVGRQTPLFERDMRYIIFRPYWVIPRTILKKEILPAARKSGSYLAKHHYEIYSGNGDFGPSVPTTAANLDRVARGELNLRQKPGPKNSLGLAKFIFPNDYNVYFHGTPATELFSRARRDFSHGCIRLESPPALAVWVLRDPQKWPPAEVQKAMDGPKPRQVNLAKPLPVFIYYSTAAVRADGKVVFYEDVYRHDAALEHELAKGYPFAP